MATTNPFYEPPRAAEHFGPPHIRFSRTEVMHLALSVAALTVAFGLVLNPSRDVPGRFLIRPIVLASSFLAVASGFVLHELAHKVVAQRYGHWAEFRAQFAGLGLTILLAAATRFLFAAPGAVVIQGRVTPRENGLISLVGPGVNIVITAGLYPFLWGVINESTRTHIIGTVVFVNALLGLFNLIPLGPLDGRKVFAWSKTIYLAAAAAAIGMFILVLTTRPTPFST